MSDVVMLEKANGKWRMCIGFTDLNKVSSKDSFPLPAIDRLVDVSVNYKVLNFINAFSGYNQINMDPVGEEKTTFITEKSCSVTK